MSAPRRKATSLAALAMSPKGTGATVEVIYLQSAARAEFNNMIGMPS